jgi:FkbH-like protein
LKERGVMLALCSRNELADVEDFFRDRKAELPLDLEDFASVQVNWSSKSQNIRRIAADLNVLPSALLFIDDNGAELAKAKGALPGLRVLLADPGGDETEGALRHFPGLFALCRDEQAALRTSDVRKNRERESMRAEAADLTSYLVALRMEIRLHRNCREHAQRIHELSQKTNQFNLALGRLSRAEADTVFGPDHLTMTVAVRDALSDSGLVGAFIVRIEEGVAVVREVLFSCRVLGREVEAVALCRLCGWLRERGVERIRFTTHEGPRNQPARDWLARFLPGTNEAFLCDLERKATEASRNHPATVLEQP